MKVQNSVKLNSQRLVPLSPSTDNRESYFETLTRCFIYDPVIIQSNCRLGIISQV